MIALAPHPRGTILPVRARPGARKDAILGERAGSLRVAVSAAPERGRANEAIAEVLARSLGLRSSRVSLLGGPASRDKRFLIDGISPDEVRGRLDELLGAGGETSAT